MEVLFEGGANTQQSDWQCLQPVSHCLAHVGCLELAMVVEPFYQTVGAGVVGGGSDTGYAEEFHQVFPKVGLELTSAVRSGGWLVAWKQAQRLQNKGDGMARDLLQDSEKKEKVIPPYHQHCQLITN